jgi:hypothetical protein
MNQKQTTMKKSFIAMLMLALISLPAWQPVQAQTCTNSASGEGIIPTVSDDPTIDACDLGGPLGFKIDYGNPSGDFYLIEIENITSIVNCTGVNKSDDINYIHVESDYQTFSWSIPESSPLVIEKVIVKGSSSSNIYDYTGSNITSDNNLHSPVKGPDADPCFYDISHIEFVYSYKLDVSKTAVTSYTRTYEWDIEKTVDPEVHDLFIGESASSIYTVSVTKTGYTDSDWMVSGNITIENNTPYDALINGVSDVIPGSAVTLGCGVWLPTTLPAGQTLVCTYTADLQDNSDRINTATVRGTSVIKGGIAEAAITFGEPTTLVNDEINVTDDNGKSWGPVGESASWTYNRSFGCDGPADKYTDGKFTYTHPNTATITETGQNDDASVTVNCYIPIVSKDASTTYTRTWEWTITKTVDPAEHHIFAGDDATSTYTVSVDKTGYTDSDWMVEGTITVNNPNPSSDMTVSLVDIVSADIAAALDCGGTLTVPAGSSATCDYSAELPNAESRVNTATVTLNSFDFNASADVVFGEPTTIVDAEINVDDTYSGTLGSATDDFTWNYSRTFDCDGADDYVNGVSSSTYDNTATIRGTDESDDASVTVYCYVPVVTKDAIPSYNRYYTWTIDKTADAVVLLLSQGQQYTVNYVVNVDATYEDDDFAVSGTISIYNPHPSATMTSVALSDVLSDGTVATLDCGDIISVAPGITTCGYSAVLSDAATRTNTATAEFNGSSYTGSADVKFGGPDDLIDECIDVEDYLAGPLGTVCADDATKEFRYSLVIGNHPDADIYLECGANNVYNFASFLTNDTKATGDDDWTVLVEVACDQGCTLTQGYWKTHSKYGPAPYDDNWANLGDLEEDEPFFISGQTYYEVLWTPPAGNVYYILAHQYIAATLNVLNGTDAPPDVTEALEDAADIFDGYDPSIFPKGQARREFINLAQILDDYNNGVIGPGHCSEEEVEDESSVSSNLKSALNDNPIQTELEQITFKAYPNPFDQELNFHIVLPYDSKVTLEVYDLVGKKVAILYNDAVDAGQLINVTLNTADIPRQALIYRFTTSHEVLNGKLIPLER